MRSRITLRNPPLADARGSVAVFRATTVGEWSVRGEI
jgi:hypothetical protein